MQNPASNPTITAVNDALSGCANIDWVSPHRAKVATNSTPAHGALAEHRPAPRSRRANSSSGTPYSARMASRPGIPIVAAHSGRSLWAWSKRQNAVGDSTDRKSVVSGTSGSVRVDIGGRRDLKKKKKKKTT